MLRHHHHGSVIAATVIGASILLGSSACSGVSTEVSRGHSGDRDSAFSVETSHSWTDVSDAKDDIRTGNLPQLPADARAIESTDADGTRYVSWKGGRINDDSCTTDAASKVPTMPDAVARKQVPTTGVTTCDFGAQSTAGDFTYFWSKVPGAK